MARKPYTLTEEQRARKRMADRARMRAKNADKERTFARKVSHTDRVIMIWAKENTHYTHEHIAQVFGVTPSRLYQLMQEHREYDNHDPYCRGLTATSRKVTT